MSDEANEQLENPEDGKGEILVRGPGVSPGWLAEDGKSIIPLVDADGWLHTKDFGVFNDQGNLQIAGRAADAYKLPNGEFVHPASIEAALVGTAGIAHICIFGRPEARTTIGIVFVDVAAFTEWMDDADMDMPSSKMLTYGDSSRIDEVLHDKAICEKFSARIRAHGKRAGLRRFEIPGAFYLTRLPTGALASGAFDGDDDALITSTLKIRRQAVERQYGAQIASLYESTRAAA